MKNKLVVIINSLKVPKIKKVLLYEMKFLVPNYSCLKNPWLRGYRPQIPVLSVLNWICWTPPRTKFLGTPLDSSDNQLKALIAASTETRPNLMWYNQTYFDARWKPDSKVDQPVQRILHNECYINTVHTCESLLLCGRILKSVLGLMFTFIMSLRK